MLKYDPQYPLISLHVMKTVGTTLGLILQKWFGEGYHNQYVDHKNFIIPTPVKQRNAWGIRKRGICVHGHFINGTNSALDLYPDARQFVAFLRDPLNQHVSAFYFQLRVILQDGQVYFRKQRYTKPVYIDYETDRIEQTDDLNQFIAKGRCTILRHMPFDFTTDNYRDIFDSRFVHVGCHEHFKDSVYQLAAKLDKPTPKEWPFANKGNYKSDVPPILAEDFYKRHPLELEMSQYSISLCNSTNP